MRIKIEVRIYDNENQKYNRRTKEFDRTANAFKEVNRELNLEIPNDFLGAFAEDIISVSTDIVTKALTEYHDSDPAKQEKEGNNHKIPNPEALGELPF